MLKDGFYETVLVRIEDKAAEPAKPEPPASPEPKRTPPPARAEARPAPTPPPPDVDFAMMSTPCGDGVSRVPTAEAVPTASPFAAGAISTFDAVDALISARPQPCAMAPGWVSASMAQVLVVAPPSAQAPGGGVQAAPAFTNGGYLYSGAKAAVAHMTRLAGADLGQHNIRVNAISPGAVATPIFWGGSQRAQTLSDEENQRKMEKLEANLAKATPLPRAGLADDIAFAAVFLASDEGSFINSHDLVVDGGRIAMFNEKS